MATPLLVNTISPLAMDISIKPISNIPIIDNIDPIINIAINAIPRKSPHP